MLPIEYIQFEIIRLLHEIVESKAENGCIRKRSFTQIPCDYIVLSGILYYNRPEETIV